MSRQRANVKFARLNGVVQRVNCCLIATTLAAGASSFGQQTASITLGGTVSRIAAITVTPQNNYSSLNLVQGESEKTVAIVNELSNDKAGYTVTLTSLGAGTTSQAQLHPVTPGNPDTIPYSMNYDGANVTLVNGTATLTASGARTPGAGVNHLLAVTVPASAGANADTYSDTLRLTIQGN